jgi:hypothetical protein
MATAVIPAATALLKARGRDDGSVELHHAMGHDRTPRLRLVFRLSIVEALREKGGTGFHNQIWQSAVLSEDRMPRAHVHGLVPKGTRTLALCHRV